MSILHSFWRAIAAETQIPIDVFLLVLALGSIAIAIYVRVLPLRQASGRGRLFPGRSAWQLAAVLCLGFCTYLFTSSLYSRLKYPPAQGTTQPAKPPHYTAADNAFLNTVPGLIGFCVMLLGDRFVRSATGHDLGIGARNMPRGIFMGLVGTIIVVPPLVLLEQLLELFYRGIHYQHPLEHPLLKVLGERPSPFITACIVVAACVIAPLFEEFVFRGHVQTLLRRVFSNRPSAEATTSTTDPGHGSDPGGTRTLSDETPQPLDPVTPNAWHTWAAILVTSIAFASVHPGWSQPIIFVLSVCLGYAYERTGNLWVPITIHAVFNSISMAIFLTGLGPH
jgi:membrane protease YdiL (CAAX protease family)